MPFKTFLINKIKNQKFRLNGIVRSSRLPRKKQLCQAFRQHRLYAAEQLPPKVDLRPDMTPVEDQSQIGSCTANSLAGAYEYLTKKANGLNTDISRLFIYYNSRVKANNGSGSITDSGCSMTDAIEALEEFGTCLESIWPYDISRVNTRPNDQAYQQAKDHKINEALQINIDLNDMKSCLAQGYPFAFGLQLYTSFDKAAQTGVVPMPDVGDGNRDSDGSHALLAVGYSDQSNAFIVRNSWGEDWGDKGYCYIPYDYLTNPDLCFDVWTIRKVANDDFSQDNWHFHDTVNYLHVHHNRFSDDTDDDNHTIEGFDEDDDGNYNTNQDTWGNDDNNFTGNTVDYTDPYQRNDYSTNDVYFNDNRNQYDQDYKPLDDNGFNPDRNFSYSEFDQFRDGTNNFGGSRGGFSDYN